MGYDNPPAVQKSVVSVPNSIVGELGPVELDAGVPLALASDAVSVHLQHEALLKTGDARCFDQLRSVVPVMCL